MHGRARSRPCAAGFQSKLSLMDSDVIFLDQEARVLSSEVLGEEGPHCGGWPQSLGNEPLAPRSEPECGE